MNVFSVKVATLSLPDIEAEISQLVVRAAECLDHLCPYGKLMNTVRKEFLFLCCRVLGDGL